MTPCAECARTWRIDYAPFFAGKPPRVLHLADGKLLEGAARGTGGATPAPDLAPGAPAAAATGG